MIIISGDGTDIVVEPKLLHRLFQIIQQHLILRLAISYLVTTTTQGLISLFSYTAIIFGKSGALLIIVIDIF